MIYQEKTMLYLTDLPFGISNEDIKEFLSKYADKIKYINPDQNQKNNDRIKPKAIKVLFTDYESANKCRIEMNLRKLRGRSVRIMWDERDTSIRYNTKNNLFIKGIPKTTTPREVYEYFLQFGDISSCKIKEDGRGSHNGYGYITYYKGEDAQRALDETKDKKIFGTNNLEISHFQKKNERIINSNDNHKIFINHFPEKFKVEDLKKLCSEYGKVESCNIFIDNLCQNFGIVQFSSEAEAKEALDKLDGKEISEGQKIMAKLFQNKYEHEQYLQNSTKIINEKTANCNLYIKNIPLTVKDENLKTIFSKFGNVESVRIEKSKIEKKDEKGKYDLVSKGFGFLSFDNPESAKKAIEELNGKYLPGFEGWNRTLIIEFFRTKNERQFMENQEINYSNYMMNNNNQNNNIQMNFIGRPYQYPYSYPNNFIPPHPMHAPFGNPGYFPVPFNQLNNNPYNNLSYKKNWRGGNKTKNIIRYNNYRGNKKIYNNKRERKVKNEENEDKKNENKIDLTEYYKLESIEDKKDFLGEKLYHAIEESPIIQEKKADAETIGKITGMIIELPDQNEIIGILENQDILNGRIEEALNLIEDTKK